MTAGMVHYVTSLDGLHEADLAGGFWVGWPIPPTPATHLAMLRGSEAVVLALDDSIPPGTAGRVIGYVTAIGDGVVAASIPCLEVLPAWQGQGIGSELLRRVLVEVGSRYMVDLVCDEDLVPFYERHGFVPYLAMIRRDRAAIMTALVNITGEAVDIGPDEGDVP